MPEIVLHQPSGILYLACSTPTSRTHWAPAVSHLNAAEASFDDYVATYDALSQQITRLELKNFTNNRGLSVHGMDVVASSRDPKTLFVYVVNHRRPLSGQDPQSVGADSSIEIFTTSVGSSTLTHLYTVESPVILTPNDIVGSADADSFFFTNDHGRKTGVVRRLVCLTFCLNFKSML